MNERLIELTARLAAAYLRNNTLPAAGLTELITSIHGALRNADAPQIEPTQLTPAVPIRSSVRPGHIVCLECGMKAKMLKRHLSAEHGLTPEAYKAKWRLAPTYPLVAPEYAATRSSLAKRIGLGRKAQPTPEPQKVPPHREPAKKLRSKAGRAQQEAEREQPSSPAKKRASKKARA